MATTVFRAPLFIRPWRAVKLGRGEQLDVNPGVPLPIQIISNQYGDGAAQGDANADATNASDAFPFSTWTQEYLDRRGQNSRRILRGPQIEFQTPLPIQIISNRDGDGTAQGDAVASSAGTFDVYPFSNFRYQHLEHGPYKAVKLGRGEQLEPNPSVPLPIQILQNLDGDGAAQGDANASATSTFDTYPFANFRYEHLGHGPYKAVKLGRGAQIEFQTSLPIRAFTPAVNNQDGAGSAVGDAIAGPSGGFSCAFDPNSFDASCNGDSTVFPFAVWEELEQRRGPNRAVKLGRGAQIEFHVPTPLTPANGDAIGTAQGDAIAAATGESLADAAASATGDAIVSATGAPLADADAAATGDAIASAMGTSDSYPFANWKELLYRRGPNRAVKLGRGAQIEFKTPLPIGIISNQDAASSAIGDANAAATGDSLFDGAGSASGDAIVSGASDKTQFDFSVWTELLLRKQHGKLPKLGRGAQIEFQTPLVTLVKFFTGDGTAIGDATASAISDTIYPPFAQNASSRKLLERGPNRPPKLGRGSQFEFQSPLTIRILHTLNAVGSAIGGTDAAGYPFIPEVRNPVRVIHSRELSKRGIGAAFSKRTSSSESSARGRSAETSARTVTETSVDRTSTEVF